MKTNEVGFISCREHVTKWENQTKFSYRPERGWKWVQKFCLWTLRKIGAFAIDETAEIKEYKIDCEKILDLIREQRVELCRMGYEPVRVLIGSRNYDDLRYELRGDDNYFHHVAFSLQSSPTIEGLEIEIVPWMRGVLVMPQKKEATVVPSWN